MRKKLNIFFLFTLLSFIVLTNIYHNAVFKILASASFVASACVNFMMKDQKNKEFSKLFLCGIFFAFFGDVVIIKNFVAGAVFFAIGHILYYLSYLKIKGNEKRSFLISFVLFVFALMVILFTPFLKINTSKLILCIVYSMIISIMVGKAISLHISDRNKFTLILMVGSIMFMVSDIMVLFHAFSDDPGSIFKNIGSLLYFPGQYILAQALRLNSISKLTI